MGSSPILINLVGVHRATSTQNLKQIHALVSEREVEEVEKFTMKTATTNTG